MHPPLPCVRRPWAIYELLESDGSQNTYSPWRSMLMDCLLQSEETQAKQSWRNPPFFGHVALVRNPWWASLCCWFWVAIRVLIISFICSIHAFISIYSCWFSTYCSKASCSCFDLMPSAIGLVTPKYHLLRVWMLIRNSSVWI